ncbi:MAG: phosphatase PAP2 family protein [Spirochaetes bacterium]|nr:phosphatase PAP2 family protein [Spirochaetota bacterium]
MKKIYLYILIFLNFLSSRYFSIIYLFILIFLTNVRFTLNFVFLSGLNFIITYLLKIVFNKKRKPVGFLIPDKYRLPSGHSSNCIILIFFILLTSIFKNYKNIFINNNFLIRDLIKIFIIKIKDINQILILILFLIIFSLSLISRFLLKIHKIEEILAGIIVGFLSILIYVIILDKYFNQFFLRKMGY